MERVEQTSSKTAIFAMGLSHAGCLLTLCIGPPAYSGQITTVFVIALENHNWTQPASQISPGQILGSRYAPYINSLVTSGDPHAAQVSYASNYVNAGPGIHPSEPNYIWAEAGSNLGVKKDNDPYGPGGTNQTTADSLSNYLQRSGKTWRSYQEDTNVNSTDNQPIPKNNFRVPLKNFSGKFASGRNIYNGSMLIRFTPKATTA